MEHADAVIVGEGEVGWPDLLADLRGRRPLSRVYARQRPRVRPGRCAHAALRPARHRALQPPHRPDPARLPVALRLLRRLHPPDAQVQGQAGREGRSPRSARSSAIWPKPFIEFADDNTFVNRRHAKDLLRALAAERLRWFTETRHRHRRRPRAAGPDARIGVPPGPHRSREPDRWRPRGRRAAPELEAVALRRLQGGHRTHPVPRHRRQRLLRPRPRRRRAGGLRGGRALRPRERPVRRPDHGHDALPRHAALRAPARPRAASSRRARGSDARSST